MNDEKELTGFGLFFGFVCFVLSIGLIGIAYYLLYRYYYGFVVGFLIPLIFGYLEETERSLLSIILKLLFVCNFVFLFVISFDNSFTRNWIFKKD